MTPSEGSLVTALRWPLWGHVRSWGRYCHLRGVRLNQVPKRIERKDKRGWGPIHTDTVKGGDSKLTQCINLKRRQIFSNQGRNLKNKIIRWTLDGEIESLPFHSLFLGGNTLKSSTVLNLARMVFNSGLTSLSFRPEYRKKAQNFSRP